MMRVVRVGDEAVEGTSPRLPGRGAYVHRDCLPLAVQRHAFRRAFGSGVGTDRFPHNKGMDSGND